MEQMLRQLFEQVQYLQGQLEQQTKENRELRASLAMIKHPELASQYPLVAAHIEQREQNIVSALNDQMELESAFKK